MRENYSENFSLKGNIFKFKLIRKSMEINELNEFLKEDISPHEKLKRLLDVSGTKIFLWETGSKLLSILHNLACTSPRWCKYETIFR